MKALFSSLRWRIFLFYSSLLAAAIVVLVVIQIRRETRAREEAVAWALQSRALELIPLIFPPPSRVEDGRPLRPRPSDPHAIKARDALLRFAEASREKNWFVLAVDSSNTPVFDNGIVPVEFSVPPFRPDGPRISTRLTDSHLAAEIVSPLRERIFVGIARPALRSESTHGIALTILFGAVVFLVVSATGWWLLGHGLRPIRRFSETARRIATKDIAERLDVPSQNAELAELAATLNATFDQLGDLLHSQARFTADASHELRTPVAAILAECQFSLKQVRPAERYRETIEVCHESARHMSGLIERLGLLARMDESPSALNKESIPASDLIREVMALVRPEADQRKIRLSADIPAMILHVDRLRFFQVLVNLAQNAITYNRPGGRVEFVGGTDGAGQWIEVRDSGIGIAAEHLPRIFDRFYRADSSRAATTGGSGLGLAIALAIVEAHGGRLSVSSIQDSGTTFRIDLPKSDKSPP